MQNVIDSNISYKQNGRIDNDPSILHRIHEKDVNIVIYNRAIDHLNESIPVLIDEQIEFRSSGDMVSILKAMKGDPILCNHMQVIEDVRSLLFHFNNIVDGNNFRLLLATINSNMCRKFHSDINDLRMLCTYSGPGTLWLTDDNIDYNALNTKSENESIVIDTSKIKQVKTGSVAILKGAIYPNEHSNPVIHRSPAIESKGVRRLLLRIDSNQTINLWA